MFAERILYFYYCFRSLSYIRLQFYILPAIDRRILDNTISPRENERAGTNSTNILFEKLCIMFG